MNWRTNSQITVQFGVNDLNEMQTASHFGALTLAGAVGLARRESESERVAH